MSEDLEKNYEKAFQLFLKGALKGLDCAQNNVAEMYRDGEGTNKNKAQAIKYFKLAAKQGYKQAKDSLKNLQK
jgi:TPR repeat protein